MKKIIKGRLYDTEKAKELAHAESNLSKRDFHWWQESLFRKRSGEFFLHGEGGPMTHYAVSCGQNQWDGGEGIIPLSYQKAQEWAEKNLDADDYEAIFGEVSEDDEGSEPLTVRISAEASRKLRRMAGSAGASLGSTVERLILSASEETGEKTE